MDDELEYKKFIWHLTLDELYQRLSDISDPYERNYIKGKIDAYEDILGEL